MMDADDPRPAAEGGPSEHESSGSLGRPPTSNGDPPTAATPLGAASLWKQLLRDPERHRDALDALASKPERWGDYTQVATIMERLTFADMPVSYTLRSHDVAYVRLRGGSVDWFLTTVRGADELWRVYDLTEESRPRPEEINGG